MLSRRDFLKLSASSAIVLAGSVSLRAFSEHNFMGLALAQEGSPGRELLMVCDAPGSIKGLEVASGESFSVEVPFFGHAVTQNFKRPEQVVSFEKKGLKGGLVDIADRKIVAVAQAREGSRFLGHASFSSDGAMLLTTEGDYGAMPGGAEGKLVMRNAADLAVIQIVESYGKTPHECRTPDSGRTIIVANEGMIGISPSNIAWIDMASGSLLHRVEFDTGLNIAYSHFDISHDNWACVGGMSHKGIKQDGFDLVTFVSPEGQVFVPDIPADIRARLKVEALSVAFLGKSGLVAATLPAENMVLILDYRSRTLIEAITLPHPLGIVPSLDPAAGGRGMIVSSRKDKDLIPVMVTAENKVVTGEPNRQFGGTGSHLTRMYI